MAPLITSESMLPASMPPKSINPVTGLYIVESAACWLLVVLMRSMKGACPASSEMLPTATPGSEIEFTTAALSWIPPRAAIGDAGWALSERAETKPTLV